MKLTMLLLTGIGLILCMIAFIILVIIFIINDIKIRKRKVGNMKIDAQIEQYLDYIRKAVKTVSAYREMLERVRKTLQLEVLTHGETVIGNQILEIINAIDALLREEMFEMDARTKAIVIINSERVQALEDAGLMIVDRDEIDRLKKKINVVLHDFHQYVRGGKEICAFCLLNDDCEPGETLCGATFKGFTSRWLNEKDDL